ncbi:Serine/threonine-protein kinase PrkC (plasmid) [Pseudoalteromonas sp. THAF3]|uniref:serine/threonine-protein kinase n=1 Tax=Pseudoalteromonas sp. THAF3 TaxID=2587843 RepID=UPI0012689999|nr:serine/threonine-protein kinase [Pseudoalteromonas sp. THAF3]QFU06585.1 Serine/threonine-protein kinase PrkC [Pseudoalteromonas sp. THAF3]
MDDKPQNASEQDKTQIAGIANSGNAPQKNAQSANLQGLKLGARYLLEELVGQGGMSDIYRAKDLHLSTSDGEHHVVIKVLQSQFAESEQALALLKKEAQRCQQLSHPNIVRVYDCASVAGIHYIVMEWIEGETLEQIIKRSRPTGMKFANAKPILTQMIDALIYAHAHGVVHTDLKPSNVMVTSQGDVKILDFGVARAHRGDDIYAYQGTQAEDGVAGYTPAYASASQLDGQEPTPQDDIFSFACIAYELISSNHPYDRVAANEVPATYTLKKPASMPMLRWGALKKALSISQPGFKSFSELKSKLLTVNHMPAVAAVATVAVVAGLGFTYHTQAQSDYALLQAKYDNAVAKNEQLNQWMGWGPSNLFSKLGEIPPQYQVLKQGLVVKNQPQLLAQLEQQAKLAGQNKEQEYKNFTAIINVYDQAKPRFPDSLALAELIQDTRTEQQSVLDGVVEKIDLLLSQGRLTEGGDNSLVKLSEDLAFIAPEFNYQPMEAGVTLYLEQYQAAVEADDVATLDTLAEVGEAVFAQNQQIAQLLQQGEAKREAMTVLAQYFNKRESNPDTPYPYEAATAYYQDQFDAWEVSITNMDDHKELIALEEEVNTLAEKVPEDFQPMVKLKKSLASAYLSKAHALMQKRMYRTAQKLIERSDSINKSLSAYL